MRDGFEVPPGAALPLSLTQSAYSVPSRSGAPQYTLPWMRIPSSPGRSVDRPERRNRRFGSRGFRRRHPPFGRHHASSRLSELGERYQHCQAPHDRQCPAVERSACQHSLYNEIGQ